MKVTDRIEAALAVLLGASVFVAASPALGAYRIAGAGAVVGAAAATSVLLAYGGARMLRVAPVWSYALSLAGLVVLLLIADGPHYSPVIQGVVHGPNRILTETLPLSGNRAALSALVVLVWVFGAATGETGARMAARGRPFALLIPVALYVTCFAAASSAPARPRYGGPVLLVCLAASAALIRLLSAPGPAPAPATGPRDVATDEGAPSGRHAAVTGVAASAAVAAVLALIAPSVPGLRTGAATVHRRPPTTVPVVTDPLDSMAQLRDGQPARRPTPLLTVTMSQLSTGYLAAGYLDLYDGGQWRFAGAFQPTGGRVPGAVGASALVSGRQVTQKIAVTGSLPVPLLPALDRPTSVTGLDVVADPATGMLLPQTRVADPTYTVRSTAAAVTLGGLPPADGTGQSPDVDDLQLPPDTSTYLATTARFVATLTGERPEGSVAFLQDALRALQEKEKRVDPAAAGGPSGPTGPTGPRGGASTTTTVAPTGGRGTSLSEVINAVTVNRAATPEQFATFYALIARYLGVPARVVTGFRLAQDSSGRPLPAGSYRATNRQAWAWVEIPVVGLGWVVCDPTPDSTTAAGTTPPESVSAPATTIPPRQANAVPRSVAAGGHALAPPGHIRLPAKPHGSVWLFIGSALGGLLLLIGIAPGQAALRRYIRRRRRRSADPAHLAVGAWLEMLDGLERAGMRPRPGATASEVAEEVGHHFGSDLVPEATTVATTADRAVFSTSSGIPTGLASEAWASSHEICRRVLADLDVQQRMRAWCSVGSAPSRPEARRA